MGDQNQIKEGIVGRNLSASLLLSNSPSYHGEVLKLHTPIYYEVCPNFLVDFLSCFCEKMCPSVLPTWRMRYLIVLGSYMYKFNNSYSSSPKGSPTLLESISDVRIIQNEDLEEGIPELPDGYESLFSITTFGKIRYYATLNNEHAVTCVNSLREGRQEAITRSMGHAANIPYPSSWKYFDALGKDLSNSKKRVRKKVDEMNQKNIEMTGILS